MEVEKIVKDLMDTLKAVSDTQSTQIRVIDKLSDGLLHAVDVIGSMKSEIENLKKRVETLEKGGREWDR